jgi:hypothetical protein
MILPGNSTSSAERQSSEPNGAAKEFVVRGNSIGNRELNAKNNNKKKSNPLRRRARFEVMD